MRVVEFGLYERAARIEDQVIELCSTLELVACHEGMSAVSSHWGSAAQCYRNAMVLRDHWQGYMAFPECRFVCQDITVGLEDALRAVEVEGWVQYYACGLGGEIPAEVAAALGVALVWARRFRRSLDLCVFGRGEDLEGEGMRLVSGW
jgi:hypothetical protein